MPDEVQERAYAKVNLWLEILGKRPDGFHELETVMHEIDLFDDLALRKSERFSFEVDRPEVGTGEDNLAVQALRAVEAYCGRKLNCQIRLRKRSPAGGGLGGGSSDAAAVVRGLNHLFELSLSDHVMEVILADLGSDTSFFVQGGTSMCRGRGELIEPLEMTRNLTLVLVFPEIHVPTGPIFQALHLTEDSRPAYDFLRGLSALDDNHLRHSLFNRLEDAAMNTHRELGLLLRPLKEQGFLMSGSGSTIFSLAADAHEAQSLAHRVQESYGVKTQVVASASR